MRGHRRQDVLFRDEDYENYLDLFQEWCGKEQVEIGAYCLMINPVHLIVKPNITSNLSKVIGETHRRSTRMINFREHWRGYLWQDLFSSFAMDERGLWWAAAYIELNPVKAGRIEAPWDYRWSRVQAHLSGKDKADSLESIQLEHNDSVISTSINPAVLFASMLCIRLSSAFF
jgi:putative transposase